VNKIKETLINLLDYCRKHNWAGFDPYDALNSSVFARTPFFNSKICRIAFTQIMKRLPINLRPILSISREHNPKAIALFLMAFIKLSRLGLLDQEELIGIMVEKLIALLSQDTPYWCWGYNFPWQTRTILVPKGAPNLVCTVFVANSLLDAYEIEWEKRYLSMVISVAEYILNELYWSTSDSVAGFSYPFPQLRSQVYNANFLGAAFLCRIYKYSGEKKFIESAMRVTRCSVASQHDDGSWNYGDSSKQRWVDNFHTGYNLCALRSIIRYAETSEFESHILRGFEFYRKHFFREDGAPKYFHNRTYPIDIHSVAQSIITLLEFRYLDENAYKLAQSVFKWAITHMWNDDGYFYYQKLPFFTNKISYMRWSQAWMLLALSTLMEHNHILPERANIPLVTTLGNKLPSI
jgi:hypothetical protein